jgi:hypothetical protein
VSENNTENLTKNEAEEQSKILEEKVSEFASKEEELQKLWDLETKRLESLQNESVTEPEPMKEVVSELLNESVTEPEPMKEVVSELLNESVTEPEPEPISEQKIDQSEVSISLSSDNYGQSEFSSSSLLETISDAEVNSRITFEEFTDEKSLISYNALGNKQMKIKVLEVSDEIPASKWKFGDRIKVTKILVTIKHLTNQEIEEGEFDIESIERELQEKRHYTSTNRWIPATDIKNGYVVGKMHTRLISDASALDYIVF